MKITVGKKSVIARNINSVLWSIVCSLIIYGFIIFIEYLLKKYEVGLWDLLDNVDVLFIEVLGIIVGAVVSIIFLFIYLAQILDLFVGVHYFKKTETIISNYNIVQSIYSFPYSKEIETTVISSISSIKIDQSTIERLFGCGSILIEGYSNSNYSKTDFFVYIRGIDNVLRVVDTITNNFKKL